MNVRSYFHQSLRPMYRKSKAVKSTLREIDLKVDQAKHSAARVFPKIIRAEPRRLFITLTAACDNRCMGCHYGREFTAGHQLSLPVVKDLLDDAKKLKFERIRLYGGEPLLHKKLPEIVSHASDLDLNFWMTTNGVLLRKKLDSLVDAGLRNISIGMYGIGQAYDDYVQRAGRFERVVDGIRYARERYGNELNISMDWLLMKPTSDPATVKQTLELCRTFEMPIFVNLVHYSLPYFVGKEEKTLHFTEADRPILDNVIQMFSQFREKHPELVKTSEIAMRSIPDWLVKGSDMKVPCTEYRLIWIGADGRVQMCYVTFKLGNLHEKRLSELMYTEDHEAAARNAYSLNCPNCHCSYDARTLRHGPTRRQYAA